ncbi:hypothetical protein BH10PSE2_BH10PSE2_05650 [soil metagenome]
MTPHPGCKICTMLDVAAPEDVVLAGEHWGVVAMQDTPGILMAFTREHDGGIGTLSDAAAAEFGPLIKTVSAGLVATGEFEKTSAISLGDNAIHTHFMLVGRKPGDPPIFDNGPLMARFADKDRDRTRAIAARLREALSPSGTTP